jgi:hypothetical protein
MTLNVSDNMLDGNTGCHEWEAGFLLAEFVLSHPELVRGELCSCRCWFQVVLFGDVNA